MKEELEENIEKIRERIEETKKWFEERVKEVEERVKKLEESNKLFDERVKKLEESNELFGERVKKLEENIEETNNSLAEMIRERNTPLLNRLDNIDKPCLTDYNSNEFLEELEIDDKIIGNINKDNVRCTICLNNYMIHDKISYLSCLHFFHNGCIKEWLKISNKCPLCKNIMNQS